MPIDPRASDGMNGFFWSYERNVFRDVVSSPIRGLQDIARNQVLNITYLNPRSHRHIPKPPDDVVMPKKILRDGDFKPIPLLWHEDNSRRYQARERQQVPGAIAGPQLGEAAHRLVRNSLQFNNNTSYGLPDQFQGHHTMNKVRPTGASGSGRYYGEESNNYYGQNYSPQGIMTRPRFPMSSNGWQNDRQNIRIQDRSQYHEQFHNMKTGFHALTVDEGVKPRSSVAPSPKTPAMMLMRPQNSGHTSNLQTQFVQNIGPPIPPPNWISKAPDTDGIYVRHQEAALGGAYDKPIKKVYQIKTRNPQDMPEQGNQW